MGLLAMEVVLSPIPGLSPAQGFLKKGDPGFVHKSFQISLISVSSATSPSCGDPCMGQQLWPIGQKTFQNAGRGGTGKILKYHQYPTHSPQNVPIFQKQQTNQVAKSYASASEGISRT